MLPKNNPQPAAPPFSVPSGQAVQSGKEAAVGGAAVHLHHGAVAALVGDDEDAGVHTLLGVEELASHEVRHRVPGTGTPLGQGKDGGQADGQVAVTGAAHRQRSFFHMRERRCSRTRARNGHYGTSPRSFCCIQSVGSGVVDGFVAVTGERAIHKGIYTSDCDGILLPLGGTATEVEGV